VSLLNDFDHLARIYDLLPIPTDPRPIAEALAGVDGPAIDLGGGTGRFTVRLHPDRSPRVIVDRSRGMLAQAVETQRPVSAVLGDGAALPVADASVGAVTVTEAFHHFTGSEDAILAEVGRVLAPDGVLAIHEIDPGRLLGRAIELGEALVGFGSTFRTPEALEALLLDRFGTVEIDRTGSFTYLATSRGPLR
jgi:demethylmenaquinone methyltransferase/2-methoxy-6-polyprenyl-1,4-benzoquinol methylase